MIALITEENVLQGLILLKEKKKTPQHRETNSCVLFWSGQIWRPITATFYFPVGPGTGFLYLVNLYFLYQYSTRLETGKSSLVCLSVVFVCFANPCIHVVEEF